MLAFFFSSKVKKSQREKNSNGANFMHTGATTSFYLCTLHYWYVFRHAPNLGAKQIIYNQLTLFIKQEKPKNSGAQVGHNLIALWIGIYNVNQASIIAIAY